MDLNDDVVTRILLYLPVQSLLRFRCVCSSWRNKIDSSYFTTSHLQNQRKKQWVNDGDDDLRLLQVTKTSMWHQSMDGNLHKLSSAIDEFLDKNPYLYVVGCIDGLICMFNDISSGMDDCCLLIAILNPCLGKIKFVPTSPMCPTFDDGKHWYASAGFGFDRAANDYKVLQLIRYVKGPVELEVYSSATNTWKKLPNDICDEFFDGTCCLCPIQGRCCSSARWQVVGGSSALRRYGDISYLHSFDFEHEEFDVTLYPNLDYEKYERSLSVFAKDDDSLVLFITMSNEIKLEMWELVWSNKCWSHVRDIDVVGVYGSWPGWPHPEPSLIPGTLWKGDGVVLVYCERPRESESEVILYEFSTESVKIIFTDLEDSWMYTLLLEYRSSLVSP